MTTDRFPAGRTLEARSEALLTAAAVAVGLLLQECVRPSPFALVVFALLLGGALAALGLSFPRRIGNGLGGFGAAAAILLLLAGGTAVGTLVVQEKPEEIYARAYGRLATLVLRLGLGEVAHSFWFAALLALLGAGLLVSMAPRWPLRRRNLGFFAGHVGLLSILAGAAISALFAVKGRIDLRAGGPAADAAWVERDGQRTGRRAPLGFSVALDRFDVDRYAGLPRLVVYREDVRRGFTLAATFEPSPGARHRLPGGGRFTVRRHDAAPVAASSVTIHLEGVPGCADGDVTLSRASRAMLRLRGAVLAFTKSAEEARTYRSTVTIREGGRERRGTLAVNEPLAIGGWSLYQVDYDPDDPSYSGLAAVRDPGVPWVFSGFFLTALGVVLAMFEPRLRASKRS